MAAGFRRDGGAVDRACLENKSLGNRTESSNLSPSAKGKIYTFFV